MEEKKDFYWYIKDQFTYGGEKYTLAGSSIRESTDDLFDDFGKNWLIGTLGKYVKRFINTSREKDPLKIATYMYIIWLKRGFYIDDKRRVPLDTNIDNKTANFDTFLDRFTEYNEESIRFEKRYHRIDETELSDEDKKIVSDSVLGGIYDNLKKMATLDWTDIKERDIFYIFRKMRLIWEEKFSNVEEHDLDTYNKEDK